MNVVLPLLTALASFSFAALVLDQWRRRRRSFQIVWGLGLICYGIGAATEFAGSALGWTGALQTNHAVRRPVKSQLGERVFMDISPDIRPEQLTGIRPEHQDAPQTWSG